MKSALEFSRDYMSRSWQPLPVLLGSKKPIGNRWQNFTCTEAELERHFSDSVNIGLLLGPASSGLVDVDVDAAEAVCLAPTFLPETYCISGREGKPDSHFWFYSNVTYEKFNDPVDGSCLVEIRSKGQQTVVPPSRHPDGGVYYWTKDGDPAKVDPGDLRSFVAALAACSLISRYWFEGTRHQISLALAGLLLTGGKSEEAATLFIQSAADAAGDEEAAKRVEDVRTTAAALARKDNVVGRSALAKLLPGDGKKITEKLVEWLRLKFKQKKTERPAQGQAIELQSPEPWPDPVDGSQLIYDIGSACRRFVVVSGAALVAEALWIIHAHSYDCFAISPILAILSPTMRCGKSLNQIVISTMLPKVLTVSNITPQALFRTIEKFAPVLILDEADTWLDVDEQMRGVLNSGHWRNTAYVVRATGDTHEPRKFRTWCPKSIALIGQLPHTLMDRSIVVPMMRKTRDHRVERFSFAKQYPELNVLARKIARWVQDHEDELRNHDPDVPETLDDRARDNWRVLISIADVAGEPWPKWARLAARHLGNGHGEESESVEILKDLRRLFHSRVDKEVAELIEKLSSKDIMEKLIELPDRPWGDYNHGRGITQRQIAMMLKGFGIHPETIRLGDTTVKGYKGADFSDAFSRYLTEDSDETGFLSVTTVTNDIRASEINELERIWDPSQSNQCYGSKKQANWVETKEKRPDVTDVTDENPDIWQVVDGDYNDKENLF